MVAESLHRIQNKLNRGKKLRDNVIHKRVSRLSKYHSELDDAKSNWDQSCYDEKEDNLYKNVKKAELADKKIRTKAKKYDERADMLS